MIVRRAGRALPGLSHKDCLLRFRVGHEVKGRLRTADADRLDVEHASRRETVTPIDPED